MLGFIRLYQLSIGIRVLVIDIECITLFDDVL